MICRNLSKIMLLIREEPCTFFAEVKQSFYFLQLNVATENASTLLQKTQEKSIEYDATKNSSETEAASKFVFFSKNGGACASTY